MSRNVRWARGIAQPQCTKPWIPPQNYQIKVGGVRVSPKERCQWEPSPGVWGIELLWHKPRDDQELALSFVSVSQFKRPLWSSGMHRRPLGWFLWDPEERIQCPHTESDHSQRTVALLLSHSSSRLSRDFALGMEDLTSSSSELDLWLHRKLSKFQKDLQLRNFLWVGQKLGYL